MAPDFTAYVRRHLPPLDLRPEREAGIIAELAGQLEQAYRESLRAGLSEPEAAASAHAHIKDWQALAAAIRAAETPVPPEPTRALLPGLLQDLRYALRTVRRNPSLSVIVILTLAFGIGGNTAIFTVVDHIALRGLPYPESGRLIDIDHTKDDQPEVDPWCSFDNFSDFRKRSQAFESIAAVSPVWNNMLALGPETERLETLYASADFFPMLRVQPHIGRLFTAAEDDRAQPAPVAVLSYEFWTRRFAASPAVLGKVLQIDGSGVTVIGVLPEQFRWRGGPLAGTSTAIDIWMPLAANQLARSPRLVRFLKVTGRLKPGITVEQGRDEVRRIGDALTREYPGSNRNLSFNGVPLQSKITAPLRPAIYLLLATVGFVLLMASANVANLLLARAVSRTREISVRVALGASRLRVLRQMMTESAVLAFLGAAVGLAVAEILLRLILANGPPALIRTMPISLDSRALAFTTGVAILTAMLAGVVPAWRAVAGNLATAVRQGRGLTAGSHRARTALAIAQVTIALVLIIGAGLLIRSFLRVLSINPGFDLVNVVSVSTLLPPGDWNAQQRTNIYNTVHRRLLATPGVTSVGAVSRVPMLGLNLASILTIEGQEDNLHPPEVEYRAATPDYFTTLRIPLKSGRLFDDRDSPALQQLVIDEITASRYFPGQNPIGKRVRFQPASKDAWFTIIGVVGYTRHFGLEAQPRPTVYRPASLNPLSAPIFVIRTATDPAPWIGQLAQVVRTAYGNMPAYNVFAMQELVDRSTAERRFLMWLLTAFACAALLLAAIGIYGAVSQSVAQRTQEIGVRIALGATPADALLLVFAEGLRIAAAGLALGLAAGCTAARLGQSLLYGVRPNDWLVLSIAPVVLLLFVALACYIPARRATKVDPLVTLREV